MGVETVSMDVGFIIQFFRGLPSELIVTLLAMIPFTELRVSIPVALEVFHFSIFSAIFWSVLGDMVPATIILIFIGDIAMWLSKRSEWIRRWYEWSVRRTSKQFSSKASRYGLGIALIIFVGIPLPMTGSWTGALAAFLFGVPKRFAWMMIFVGVCLSAVIVTLVSLGVVKLFF